MAFATSVLLSVLAASAVTASPIVKRGTTSISLTQQQGSPDIVAQAVQAASKYAGAVSKAPIAPETLDAGFWYGNFSVGKSTSLSLLIDTGSSDVAVNPGAYKPSSTSKNLNKSGSLGYETVQENGCGVADIKYNQYQDSVSFEGLTSTKQTFGNVVKTTPPNSGTITQFPHDGIVGFSGTSAANTQLDAVPFFQNLCSAKAVAECRFGLAFGTDGTGEQILGGVDSTLYEGALSTATIADQWEFNSGELVVNGTKSTAISNIVLDSGTANIVGPPDQVKALFEQVGIQPVEQNLPGCTSVLFGYYNCRNPPTIGFSFTSDGKVFNIEPSAFVQADNGNNNCTAIITGIDLDGLWIVGQAWFQGKYVDHDATNKSVGIATLKNTTSV